METLTLPEVYQPLREHYDIGPCKSSRTKIEFRCRKCEKVWQLQPFNPKHQALAEHLVNHAVSHE